MSSHQLKEKRALEVRSGYKALWPEGLTSLLESERRHRFTEANPGAHLLSRLHKGDQNGTCLIGLVQGAT